MRNASEVTLEELNASRSDLFVSLAPELGVAWQPNDLVFSEKNGRFSFKTKPIEMNLPRILNLAFFMIRLQSWGGAHIGEDKNGEYFTFSLDLSYDHTHSVSNSCELAERDEDGYRILKAIYHVETRTWSISTS